MTTDLTPLARLQPSAAACVRRLAAEYRERNPELKSGYVVIFDGEVSGWTVDLKYVRSWRPGCLCVSEAGEIFLAVGGDYMGGAERWQEIA